MYPILSDACRTLLIISHKTWRMVIKFLVCDVIPCSINRSIVAGCKVNDTDIPNIVWPSFNTGSRGEIIPVKIESVRWMNWLHFPIRKPLVTEMLRIHCLYSQVIEMDAGLHATNSNRRWFNYGYFVNKNTKKTNQQNKNSNTHKMPLIIVVGILSNV